MHRKRNFEEEQFRFLKKMLLVLIVVAYPILVSIYTMLPPLIGLAGYVIMTNIDKNRVYALSGMLYLVNLDLNLTLPILLSVFIIVLIYLLLYFNLKLLIRCQVCLIFVLIVMVDLCYYLSLFLYDFMFNTSTISGDMLLVYYFVVDIFVGVFL